MKTSLSSRPASVRGYALLVVLLFTTVTLIILGATINRTCTTALLNERNNQTTIGVAAAEAATELVYSHLSMDYIQGGIAQVSAGMSQYRTRYPGSAAGDDPTGNNYWAGFSFSDARGYPNHTYVDYSSATNGWSWWTNLYSQFNSLGGNVTTYRIISNVRQINGRFNITNAVQQDVQLVQIPLFQFAIFYNSLLEFSTAATMTVIGPVHGNGDIYVGSSSPLTFKSTVSSSGATFVKTPWAGSTISTSSTINYDGGRPQTNTTTLVLPIGTNNSAAAVQQIVQPPPAGESPASSMGQQRFYNKAQFNIVISNNSVSAWVKRLDNNFSVQSSNWVPWTNMTYFINTNNTTAFYDQRENTSKPVGLTQIDIGKYNTWGLTNTQVKNTIGTDTSGNGFVPNDIWIADFRTNVANDMFAIRLTNGAALPTNNLGLTVATPNPLYVIGNYNCPSGYAGTTNTTASMASSFICDALTILSSAWEDSTSSGAYNSGTRNNPTENTTLNVAILAGVVYSTGSAINQFSGGVHNLPRMLENWSSHNLWLNTSIVNLYPSIYANGQFIYPGQAGTYYNPPTRHFTFDTRFTDPAYQPPGTPQLSVPRRVIWCNPPPGVINYNGL